MLATVRAAVPYDIDGGPVLRFSVATRNINHPIDFPFAILDEGGDRSPSRPVIRT